MKNTFAKLGNFLGTMIRKNFTSSNVLKIWAYSLLFIPVFMFVMRLAISDDVDEFVFTWFSLMVGSIILQFFINFVKKIKSGKFQYLYILIVLNITMFLSYILKNYSGDWMNDLSDDKTVKKLLIALINAAFLFLIKTLVWILLMLKWKQVKQNEENRILLEDKYQKLKKDNEVLLKEKNELEKKYVVELESNKSQYDNLDENIKQCVYEKSQENKTSNKINEDTEKKSIQKNSYEYSANDSDNNSVYEKSNKHKSWKKIGFKKNKKVSLEENTTSDNEEKAIKQSVPIKKNDFTEINDYSKPNENPKIKNRRFGPGNNINHFDENKNENRKILNTNKIVEDNKKDHNLFEQNESDKTNTYSYSNGNKNIENKKQDTSSALKISNEAKKPELNNIKLRSYSFESSNETFKKNDEFNRNKEISKKNNQPLFKKEPKEEKTNPWIEENKHNEDK